MRLGKRVARIKVKEGVVFCWIPPEMVRMFDALLVAGAAQGVNPTITGACGPSYPVGKVHRAGYAIDVRTRDIPDPARMALDIKSYLGAVSPHYKVLYGDAGHLDHIHIGFAWHFAGKP